MNKKKFKNVRNILALILAFTTLFMTSTTTQAAYSKYGTYSYTYWFTKYSATIERDPTWFTVFHGNASVSTGFEYKNNTNVVLSQTKSFSIGSQNKNSLSTGVNFSGYGVPVNVGGSIEKTNSATWGVANTATRTIESTAPKGYYSYNVCINTYKIKITRYQAGVNKGSIEFFAPRSEPYRAIVYNKNNASYSGVTKY